MSAASEELDHACREARDFASHFRVAYDISCSSWKRSSSCLLACVPTTVVVLKQPSQSIHTSSHT